MTDNEIKRKIELLKKLVTEVNTIMAELEDADIEVRISYVDSKKSDETKQGIKLWRLTRHTDYLNSKPHKDDK
jgi:hypothetical protein